MANVPSSGEIVRVKLRRSAGSANCVFIVAGRSSSVRSGETRVKRGRRALENVWVNAKEVFTFLNSNLRSARLRLLLRRCVLVLLHGPNLLDGGGDELSLSNTRRNERENAP